MMISSALGSVPTVEVECACFADMLRFCLDPKGGQRTELPGTPPAPPGERVLVALRLPGQHVFVFQGVSRAYVVTPASYTVELMPFTEGQLACLRKELRRCADLARERGRIDQALQMYEVLGRTTPR
jgi:hypothetical protein